MLKVKLKKIYTVHLFSCFKVKILNFFWINTLLKTKTSLLVQLLLNKSYQRSIKLKLIKSGAFLLFTSNPKFKLVKQLFIICSFKLKNFWKQFILCNYYKNASLRIFNDICGLNLRLIYLQLKCWHIIRFLVNFKLINTDLRLLNREFIFFISTFSNTLTFIKQLFFSLKRKTISVLRSPFIYNKSYEQFQIMWSKINVKSHYKFNLLLYSYFTIWNFILFRYSILKIKKMIL